MPDNDRWTCPKCGGVNSKDIKYCPECGTAAPQRAESAQQRNPYTGQPYISKTAAPKKKYPTALIVIVCLIGLVIFGAVVGQLQNAGIIKMPETTKAHEAVDTIAGIKITYDTESTNDKVTKSETDKLTAEQLVLKAAADNFGDDADAAYVEADGATPALAMVVVDVKSVFTLGTATTLFLGNIKDTMQTIAEQYPDIAYNFIISFPATDAYGNASSKEVFYAYYSVDTVHKINWDNFSYRKLDDIADTVRIDSEIKKYME